MVTLNGMLCFKAPGAKIRDNPRTQLSDNRFRSMARKEDLVSSFPRVEHLSYLNCGICNALIMVKLCYLRMPGS